MKNQSNLRSKYVSLIVLATLLITNACSRSGDDQKSITVTFAVYEDQVETMQPIIDSYEKENAGVEIQVVPVKPEQVLELSDLPSLADVIYLEGINLADLNGFLDLRPFLDRQADIGAEDFWAGELDACANTTGALNGLPIAVSLIGIFYDSQEFNVNGIPHPKAGWTWNDFRQTIERAYQGNPGEPVFVDNAVISILDPILNAGLRTGLNANELSKATAWYMQMAFEEKIYPLQVSNAAGQTSSQEDWIQQIDDGRASVWIDSLDPGIPGPDRTDGIFAPFPVDNDNDQTTSAIVSCAGISAGSKHTAEAWEWLETLSYQNVSAGSGIHQPLPARPSITETAGTWRGLEDEVKESIQFALNHADYGSKQPTSLAILRMAIAQSIQNRSDLSQAMTAALASLPVSEPTPSSPVLTPLAINSPAPTPQSDQVTIRYLANWGSEGLIERISALIPDFQAQHPDILVNLNFGFSSQEGYILRDLAKSYDCFTYYPPGWEPMPEADLLDLGPFLEMEDKTFKEDFIGSYMDQFRLGSKLYGLPADVNIYVLAYNKDLFSDLNLTPPGPDWTLTDLLETAAKAAKVSSTSPIFGLSATSDILLDSLQIQWYDLDGGIPHAFFNTSEMAAALDWLGQLYTSGAYLPMYYAGLPEKPRNYTDYEAAISNGQVAMWIENSGINYMKDVDFKIGYSNLSVDKNGNSLEYPVSPLAHYISSQSQAPQACWAWIKFLTESPDIFGGINPRVSVLSRKTLADNQAEEMAQATRSSMQNYPGYSYQDRYNSALMRPYLDWYYGAILQVYQGQDSQVVLAEAQRKADVYYACISSKPLAGLDEMQQYLQIALPCAQQVK